MTIYQISLFYIQGIFNKLTCIHGIVVHLIVFSISEITKCLIGLFSVKPNEVRTITAGKGTLKRKQQLRDLIEHHNDGYEDDLFDSTPYRNQGNVKVRDTK